MQSRKGKTELALEKQDLFTQLLQARNESAANACKMQNYAARIRYGQHGDFKGASLEESDLAGLP